MLLTNVTGTPFTCVCVRCKCITRAGDGCGPVYADLDGTPWVDYYCEPCARAAKEEQV